MNIYEKLMAARKNFHGQQLKKTGKNSYAGYDYFELGDFLVPALSSMNEARLCAVISFTKDDAVMVITDMDKPDDKVIITSPMSEANLKGCHPVQNLGAVQTYMRRYLWVCALEIVEHDALDKTTGKDSPKHNPVPKVTLAPDRAAIVSDVAQAMREKYQLADIVGAYEEYIGITDNDEKLALWELLKPDSALRAEIRKHGESLKGEK